MQFVIAASTSYKIGEYAALVLLAILLIGLLRRLTNVSEPPSPAFTPPTSLPAQHQPSDTSTAPPGFVPTVRPPAPSAYAPVPVARPLGASKRRTSDLVAAIVVAALLAGAIVHTVSSFGGPNLWASGPGVIEETSFLDTCDAESATRINCRCFFQYIVSQPAYNTPAKFEAFAVRQEHNPPGVFPAIFAPAVAACPP